MSNNVNTFDETWDVLASSLREIHTKNASSLSFEELYRKAYRIVLMGKCGDLYERVKQLEGEWLGQEIQKRITASITSSLLLAKEPVDVQDQSNERRAAGEKFLSVLREAWEDHQLCMGMITDVLMYMVGYIVATLFCHMSKLTCLSLDNRTESLLRNTGNRPSTSQLWPSSATV